MYMRDQTALHPRATRPEPPGRGSRLLLRTAVSAALAVGMAGGCVEATTEVTEVETTTAEIKNGGIWDPWATQTQTWTRNVVRVSSSKGGCTGTLLDREWVLTAALCLDAGEAPSGITIEHTLADGSVEQSAGAELLVHPDQASGVDVALVRLADPLHPGISSLPIVGGTTKDLVGQTVFCAGYGATDVGGYCSWVTDCASDEFCKWGVCMTRNDGRLRVASFQIIEDPEDASIWYQFQVPNLLGQLELPGDAGSSCWNGQGLTGVMKSGNPYDYNRQTSGPAVRAWVESIVFQELSLQNGWTHAPFSTRTAAVSRSLDGVVRFRGAIASGTSPVAFTLPTQLRPATHVYVPIDLCGAKKGRLVIQPSGVVSVQSEHLFSSAQCFTSLEGASYLLAPPAHTPALENDWVHAAYLTRDVGMSFSPWSIVRLQGGMGNGTSPGAFTVPAGYRPSKNVYVPVDLTNARKGRLIIQPSGAVSVDTQGPFADAQLTSLEGVSFPVSTASFTLLALQNGWTNAPFGTRNAAVKNDAGIIRFAGAIASGTHPTLFTLPAELRPAGVVYVPVDLCNAAKGRLIIYPSGTVQVQAEGSFTAAQCFTSLEGAWFAR